MEILDYEKICIDSDYLIDVLRKNPEAIRKVTVFEKRSTLLATTVLNSFELYYGAYKLNKLGHLDLVNELLENLIILEWKKDFSNLAGEVMADLEKDGRRIDFRDLFIGIIALKNDFSLLTRNIKHFKRIPNLHLVK